MKQLYRLLPLLLLLLPVAAWAAQHPVEIDDKADCASCHEDKAKGKHVHSAVAAGCTSCHEIKKEKETTLVTLSAPQEELCFTCHANESKEEDSKHGPWEKGQCLLCHDAHQSDFPKQLRAAGNGLCMECHAAGKGPLPEKVKLFNSREVAREELAGLRRLRLSSDGERGHPLANHWVGTIADLTGRGGKMSCLTCHLPHSSADEKLGRVITMKGQDGKEIQLDACNACHNALDQRAAEQRILAVPEVEKQLNQRQLETQKKRDEYLKKLPKLAGDERDQQ